MTYIQEEMLLNCLQATLPKIVEEVVRVKADVVARVMVNAQAASAHVILIVLETNAKESARASVAAEQGNSEMTLCSLELFSIHL